MIGSRIAALRRGAGLSQAQLAQQLKISPSAVGMYEQGRREPGIQLLAELSRLFGVSIDYLVTGKPDIPADEHAHMRRGKYFGKAEHRAVCNDMQTGFQRNLAVPFIFSRRNDHRFAGVCVGKKLA